MVAISLPLQVRIFGGPLVSFRQYESAEGLLMVMLMGAPHLPISADVGITKTYLPLAARLEAFNGLIAVPSPLNPRRSLGGFFALLITT
jgi:hypothetical protein